MEFRSTSELAVWSYIVPMNELDHGILQKGCYSSLDPMFQVKISMHILLSQLDLVHESSS